MLLYVVLAVFIAGLMVGRTPEYLGKKIEGREVKLAVIAFLSMPLGILGVRRRWPRVLPALEAVQDPGPHGLSEILYAYLGDGQQRLGLRGLRRDTPFHTTLQGIAMLLGRFAFIVPMLAIAGSLVAKQRVPDGGHLPDRTPLFAAARHGRDPHRRRLTFFPALALGPVVERSRQAVRPAHLLTTPSACPMTPHDPAETRRRRSLDARPGDPRARCSTACASATR
jgi:potassium-transporting ATPase potassium-binding subunit